MIFLILLALLVQNEAMILHPSCGLGTTGKIKGGQTANVGDWGWQVMLNWNGRSICGGALITEQWVATAAHCLFGRSNPHEFTIDVGVHDRENFNSWSKRFHVENITIYKHYFHLFAMNDIALVKLSDPVQFETNGYKLVPVCLPEPGDYTGKLAWATGFGRLSSDSTQSRFIQQVQLPIIASDLCKRTYKTTDASVQFCAGQKYLEKDTCNGDSGGPLVLRGADNRWQLIGITSYGSNPCGDGGVYTRVSAFNDWILSVVKNEIKK